MSFGDSESGIGMVKSLNKFKETYTGANPDVISALDEIIYSIYEVNSELNCIESTFAKAGLLYEGIGVEPNQTQALDTFNQLIDESLNAKISYKNLLPLYIKKYFLIVKSMIKNLKEFII